MIARFKLHQLYLAAIFLVMVTSSQAESLKAKQISSYEDEAFQIIYHDLPITLSLPKLKDLNKTGAKLKFGLGRITYCEEFKSLNNPLDQALGVSTENLNFRIPETVANISLSVGKITFKSDLQVIKEVCDYEGEAYALYHLVVEKGSELELPVTESLLRKLQSASAGTLEIKYSMTKKFDSDGVLKWDVKDIRRYADAALEALEID